jgi:hypothetical protein
MPHLVQATEAHWDWLCNNAPQPADLRVAEGGVETLPILLYLRRVSNDLRAGSPRISNRFSRQ